MWHLQKELNAQTLSNIINNAHIKLWGKWFKEFFLAILFDSHEAANRERNNTKITIKDYEPFSMGYILILCH